MEATGQDLERYINKRNMNESAAQKFLDEYMSLKEMVAEFDSPVIEYLRVELEKSMRQHGLKVLQDEKPDDEWSIECKCGEKHSLNRAYFNVYNEAWKTINGIIKRWYKKNTAIVQGGKR